RRASLAGRPSLEIDGVRRLFRGPVAGDPRLLDEGRKQREERGHEDQVGREGWRRRQLHLAVAARTAPGSHARGRLIFGRVPRSGGENGRRRGRPRYRQMPTQNHWPRGRLTIRYQRSYVLVAARDR